MPRPCALDIQRYCLLMTTTTAAKKEQAAKWQRIWFGEARRAEAAGEWKQAQRCKENARVWAGRAAKF
jgi:hypothetical protein